MKDPKSILTKGHPYPLGDRLTLAECRAYELPTAGGVTIQSSIMAVWDGSRPRPVKKGEWYFSGALIAAYRAPADMVTPGYVGRLVKVEHVTTFKITELKE